jgi:hypothetical protein
VRTPKLVIRLALTIATATSVAGLSVAAASPAEAATGYSRCPKGYFCVFADTHGTGKMAKWKKGGDADLGNRHGPRGLNNNIESVWNRTGDTWVFWGKPHYQGTAVVIAPRVKSNGKPKFRNWASSLHRVR